RSNIPAEVVHLVFGEENFKRNYAHWLTKGEHHGVKLHNLYNITVMDIYYRMKFDELYYGPKSIPSQLLEPTPRLLQSKRPYHFLSLNAVPRPHRTLFVSELERRNLDTH